MRYDFIGPFAQREIILERFQYAAIQLIHRVPFNGVVTFNNVADYRAI
jgi:hypothetical protein